MELIIGVEELGKIATCLFNVLESQGFMIREDVESVGGITRVDHVKDSVESIFITMFGSAFTNM